jgi:hypothetical protein
MKVHIKRLNKRDFLYYNKVKKLQKKKIEKKLNLFFWKEIKKEMALEDPKNTFVLSF